MPPPEPPEELIEVWEAVGVMVHALVHVLEQTDEISRIVREINEKLDKVLATREEDQWRTPTDPH